MIPLPTPEITPGTMESERVRERQEAKSRSITSRYQNILHLASIWIFDIGPWLTIPPLRGGRKKEG
jgi:hypothetical protein